MLASFPFYRQRDAMDCGPACLMMAAAAHGRKYPLEMLRERSYLSKEGVSAKGIMEAAETLGFRTMTVKIPYDTGRDSASLLNAPLPCIAHWNQNHFVVVYEVTSKFVRIADPAEGKFKVARHDFEKSWCSDHHKGIVILLEPTPEFYRLENAAPGEQSRFSSIFGYVRPYRPLIIQLLIGMTLGTLLALVFPFLTQSIVDYGIDNRNISFINLILVAQLMLFASQVVVQFLQSQILLFMGTRINVAMISDFLAKLTRLPISFFDTKMTGDLMQRIGDQTRIETFLTQSVLSVLFSFINFLVFSAVLLLYNAHIFAIFFLAASLYILWITFFLRQRKALDYVRFQQAGENNNALIEMIQGMQEIKLQGSERKRRWIWARIQAKLFRIKLSSLHLSQWQEAGAGFINQSKNIVITFFAAKAVIDGQMTLGMMLAVQYMVGMLDAPLQQFIMFIRAAQDAKISLARLGEIRDQPDEDKQMQGTPYSMFNNGDLALSTHGGLGGENDSATREHSLDTAGGDIVLSNVSFRYNHLSEEVLKDIDLVIPQGQVTAIVGASGSGKTTLLKLLLGFYTPQKGHIAIGKTPLAALAPSAWRKHCSAVMQDGFIFSDTIANNIAECDDHPDPARLLHAVDTANIRAFIEDLPLGYNTKIGAQGNGVSQGQRQRIQIARAVYKNPNYLFFDEATNALDANNERTIVDNLQAFYHHTASGVSRTVVVVAHRLSTVRHADQIVVLDKGSMVEKGTHQELVSIQGHYYHLVKNQLELGT